MIKAIFAMDLTGGIGLNNALPWGQNRTDLMYFKNITKDNIVVMGRNTWDSLPDSFKPLPDRINVTVTSTPLLDEGVGTIGIDNIDNDILELDNQYPDKDVFIIGGKRLLESTIHLVDSLYVTEISGRYQSDVVINKDIIFDNMYKTSSREDGKCMFQCYSRTYPTKVIEAPQPKPLNFGSTLKLNKK